MRRDFEVFRWLKWILFRRERVKKFSRAEVSEADIAEEEGTGSRTTLLSFGVAQPFEKLLSTLAEGKERPLDAVAGGGKKKDEGELCRATFKVGNVLGNFVFRRCSVENRSTRVLRDSEREREGEKKRVHLFCLLRNRPPPNGVIKFLQFKFPTFVDLYPPPPPLFEHFSRSGRVSTNAGNRSLPTSRSQEQRE